MNAFLHEDLTRMIIEACFEVSREMGVGFVEAVYENALLVALRQKGLKVEQQIPLKVRFRNVVVGEFRVDVLVEEKVLLELKAVSRIAPEHKAQTINYLKATGIEVGLLINFGAPKVEYYRLHK